MNELSFEVKFEVRLNLFQFMTFIILVKTLEFFKKYLTERMRDNYSFIV